MCMCLRFLKAQYGRSALQSFLSAPVFTYILRQVMHHVIPSRYVLILEKDSENYSSTLQLLSDSHFQFPVEAGQERGGG